MTIVTRFAPSPTGYLHLGGARTALYSWLYARRHGGRFILRIEDTDQERSDPAMSEAILDSLRWLGLDWDEGPFYQSERRTIYDGLFERLVAAGLAYECYCTPEELAARRTAAPPKSAIHGAGGTACPPGAAPPKSAVHGAGGTACPPAAAPPTEGGLTFRYDGRCRDLSPEERRRRREANPRPALRLRLPEEARTIVRDLLRGEVVFEAEVLDDLVIRKSDGFPTFHFAVAVDDALMGVTHVVRGDDHLSNTPKQIRILEALATATGDARFRPPAYAHLPLILGPDGSRFSKRHGATAIGEYRRRGFLAPALVNYLSLLGWSPGDDREIFTLAELREVFDLDRVNLRGAIFDEVKLQWMNGRYIAALPVGEVRAFVAPALAGFDLTPERLAGWGVALAVEEWLTAILTLARDRVRILDDTIEEIRFFLEDEIAIDPAAAAKHFQGEDVAARLGIGLEAIEAASPWNLEEIEKEIRGRATAGGFKPPKVMHLLRVAVTGRGASPGLFETIFHVGRARAVARIRQALESLGR